MFGGVLLVLSCLNLHTAATKYCFIVTGTHLLHLHVHRFIVTAYIHYL